MMVKNMKRAIVSLVIMALMLPLLTPFKTVQAANEDWSITEGETASFGVQLQQPHNHKYYRIQESGGTRAIFRAYLKESGGQINYEKNLFCLDINGLFPTEQTDNTSSGGTATYTSGGELTGSSTVPLSSRSHKTLTGDEVQKIMAIIYSASDGLKDGTLANWLDTVFEEYPIDASDDTPTGQEIIDSYNYSVDDVQVATQLAVWKVANGISVTGLQESTSPNDGYGAPEEHVGNVNLSISRYLNAKANDASSNIPSQNKPSFESTTVTTKVIGGNVYIGPYKVNNASAIKDEKVYAVNASNQETAVSYTVARGNTASSGTYSSIKAAGTNNFYIVIPKTAASNKIKIKLTSEDVTFGLWTNLASEATSQPLASMSKEPTEVEQETLTEFPTYDVALRKYITKVNGVNVSASREPTVKPQTSGNNAGDFRYEHRKDPVTVKPGDKVTYAIRVYNESQNAVTVKGITDYLPTGLTLDTSASTGWTASSEKAVYTGDISLPGRTGNVPTTPSSPIYITCTVGADVAADRILTNVAEITTLVDADGNDLRKAPDGLEEDSDRNNLSSGTKTCPDN